MVLINYAIYIDKYRSSGQQVYKINLPALTLRLEPDTHVHLWSRKCGKDKGPIVRS